MFQGQILGTLAFRDILHLISILLKLVFKFSTYFYDSYFFPFISHPTPVTMFSKIEQVFIDSHCPKMAYHIQNAAKILKFLDRKKSIQASWIDKLLAVEIKAMRLLQAEVTVAEMIQDHEEREMRNKRPTTEEREFLQKGHERLQRYHKAWLSNTHKYHHHLFHKPKNSYIRQLDLTQRKMAIHSRAYLECPRWLLCIQLRLQLPGQRLI